MTSRGVDEADELMEFVGDITDYWSYTQVRDWALLMPGMSRTALHLYLLLRAMVSDAARRTGGGLRRMSVDQLCWLLPGVNGKPSSPTMVKDALRLLDEHGLVVNPDDGRLVTSTGKSGIQNTFRKYQVNDLPPDVYEGWRNVWDKLDAYRPDWRENPPQPPVHTRTAEGVRQIEGRISDSTGRKKNVRKPLTSENAAPKEVSLRSSSLSPVPSVTAAPPPPAEAETGQARETASPKDTPAAAEHAPATPGQSVAPAPPGFRTPAGGGTARPAMTLAAAGVPAPRGEDSGQAAEVVAMLEGLPGRLHRDDALDLAPLVADALAAGWTLPQLRGHLSRRCDPERVFDVAAVYRKYLKRLPPVPAGVGGHPAAAAPECAKCSGAG